VSESFASSIRNFFSRRTIQRQVFVENERVTIQKEEGAVSAIDFIKTHDKEKLDERMSYTDMMISIPVARFGTLLNVYEQVKQITETQKFQNIGLKADKETETPRQLEQVKGSLIQYFEQI